MATFTTPTRSEITPPRAPKISGALSPTLPMSKPVTGRVAPAAAHVRNPTRNSTANTVMSHSDVFLARYAHTADSAAITNRITVTTMVTTVTSTSIGASWIRSASVESRNRVVPVRGTARNSTRAMTANAASAMGAFQLRMTAFSSVTVSTLGVCTEVVTWSPRPSCR
jgi:hypothetical protein